MRDVEDSNHPVQKVGEGFYCSPNTNFQIVMEKQFKLEIKTYKIGFMLKVKPDKIRISKINRVYWVLNGNSDELRPYKILIKNLKLNLLSYFQKIYAYF